MDTGSPVHLAGIRYISRNCPPSHTVLFSHYIRSVSTSDHEPSQRHYMDSDYLQDFA